MYVILEHHDTIPERKRYWAMAIDLYEGARAYERMNRLVGRIAWDEVEFQLGAGLRGTYKDKLLVIVFPVLPVDTPEYSKRVMELVKTPGGYESEGDDAKP